MGFSLFPQGKRLDEYAGDIGRFFGGVADAVIPGDQSSWHRPAAPQPSPQQQAQTGASVGQGLGYGPAPTSDNTPNNPLAPAPQPSAFDAAIANMKPKVGLKAPQTQPPPQQQARDVQRQSPGLPIFGHSLDPAGQYLTDNLTKALNSPAVDQVPKIAGTVLDNLVNPMAPVPSALRESFTRVPETAARSMQQLGANIGNALAGGDALDQTQFQGRGQNNPVSKFLYGNDPITTYQQQAEDTKPLIQAGEDRGLLPAGSSNLSPLLAPVLAGLDLAPGGKPGKVALKAAAKEAERKLAEEALAQAGKEAAADVAQAGKPLVSLKEPLEGVKHGGVVQTLKKGLSDQDQVILDELRNIDKHYPVEPGNLSRVDQFMYNSNVQRGSNAVANNAMKQSENLSTALSGMSKPAYKDFSTYANARTELAMAKDGAPTSLPKKDLQAIVDAGGHHDERFQALNNHFKDVADVAHKAGLISDETHALYKKNNDYIRIQRDMGDLLPPPGRGNGYQNGSTILNQKRGGSKKAVLDAGETAAHYTQQIYKEAAKNKTGTHLVDSLHEAGLANKLVDAGTVTARRNIYKQLAETRPLRDELSKTVKKTAAELKIATKQNAAHGQKTLDKIMSNEQTVRKAALKKANGDAHLPGRSKKPAVMPTEDHMRQAFEEYIHGDPALVNALGKFFSGKQKLTELTARLDGLKSKYETLQGQRKDLFTDTLHLKDGSTKNKNTVSILRGGVKETYEVGPEIKEAINNINPYHMNAVMQILAVPGRVLRAGVTGLNPIFIARNLLKDQVGSAINSGNLLRTHNPKVFGEGLVHSLRDALPGGSHNDLYQEFLKHYGDTTSYDLTRNVKDSKKMVARLRGGKAEGLKQAVLSPINSLENAAAVTEKSTRFQNFAGEYRKAIDQGLAPDQASERAALAAWQNSVDFGRAGTWGRALNTVLPYWNPATQGVRQMGRTLVRHPAKSMFTATATIGVPLAAATAWNLSSPDTADIYNNISEFEKENNLILIPPGTKQKQDGSYDVVKIPLAPGWKDVFMPTRRALEAMYTGKPMDGQAMAVDMLQALTGPVSLQSPGAFAGSFLPQAIKPAVQQYANTDLFTGKKIVPDYMQAATDAQGNPVPENKKAYPKSSGTATAIGDALNISPIRIEKGIKDVAGTVGLMGLNAADQVGSKLGLVPEDKVGGVSLASGLKRSFGEAASNYNHNKSEGAKYFDNVKEATKGFNGNERAAYDSLHPMKKNFLGDPMGETDSTYNPAARLDVYNRFPRVLEADRQLDAKNRNAGKPGNPLFDLPPAQIKKVLEKDNLPPGARDPELSNLHQQDWYADYSTKKSKYFSDLKSASDKAGKPWDTQANPYPATSPDLQKVMDGYSALSKGTGARSSWIKANPDAWAAMQNQFASIDDWQNKQRGKRGLAATEGDAGKTNGFPSLSMGGGGSGSGFGSSASKFKSGSSGGSGGGGSFLARQTKQANFDTKLGHDDFKKISSKRRGMKVASKGIGGKPKVSLKAAKV